MDKTSDSVKIDRLLDRQMNLWEIRKRLAAEGGEPARRELAHLEQGPWITLSKARASGWEEVARLVADHLGWQVFDHEILDAISRRSHAREAILSRLDEKGIWWLEDTLSRLAAPDYPGQPTFLIEMRKVILALARQGRTILVGRGANWLLEPAFGLRVRMIAPAPERAARLAEREGLEPDRARRRIHEDDVELAAFIRQVYQRDIDDPEGYDLILNLGSLPPDAAADAIVAALRRKLGAA